MILLERTWLGASTLSFRAMKSCGPNGIVGPMYVISNCVPPLARFNWKWEGEKLFEVVIAEAGKG